MKDDLETLVGSVALALSYFSWAWSEVYPILTGLTALFGFVMVTHGVFRLLWRWMHGYPTFFDQRERPED